MRNYDLANNQEVCEILTCKFPRREPKEDQTMASKLIKLADIRNLEIPTHRKNEQYSQFLNENSEVGVFVEERKKVAYINNESLNKLNKYYICTQDAGIKEMLQKRIARYEESYRGSEDYQKMFDELFRAFMKKVGA